MPGSVRADRILASRCVSRRRRRAKYALTFAAAGIPTMDQCGAHSGGRPSQSAIAWAPTENSYATDSRRTMPLPRGSLPYRHREPSMEKSFQARMTKLKPARSTLRGGHELRNLLHAGSELRRAEGGGFSLLQSGRVTAETEHRRNAESGTSLPRRLRFSRKRKAEDGEQLYRA